MDLTRLHETVEAACVRARAAYDTASELDASPPVLRAILDVEGTVLAIKEAEIELARQIAGERQGRPDDPASVQFDGLICWRIADDGERDPHPCCPVCWDNDGRLVRLQRADPDYFNGWECRRCANHFGSRRIMPPSSKEGSGTRQW